MLKFQLENLIQLSHIKRLSLMKKNQPLAFQSLQISTIAFTLIVKLLDKPSLNSLKLEKLDQNQRPKLELEDSLKNLVGTKLMQERSGLSDQTQLDQTLLLIAQSKLNS